MKFGVVFPQTQIGADLGVLRDFAQAVEGMGYHHLLAYDHVLGANPDRPGWEGGRPYNYKDMFHEPFTLFSWMAGLTESIGFMTGVLILPQRQTALVAKQATQLDSALRRTLPHGHWHRLERGRIHIRSAIDFNTRGARVEEQIAVLRELWTKELVSFDGRFDKIDDAGINPLPPQPIPIWIGGYADVVLRRAGRLSAGYLAQEGPAELAKPMVEAFMAYAEEAGRAGEVGLHTRLTTERTPENEWESTVAGWDALGATELAVYPHGEKLDDYLEQLRRFKRHVWHLAAHQIVITLCSQRTATIR